MYLVHTLQVQKRPLTIPKIFLFEYNFESEWAGGRLRNMWELDLRNTKNIFLRESNRLPMQELT